MAASAATNTSAWVYPGPSGRLIRQPDALGNRVLDYTPVGYKSGAVPLPEVPVKVTISPIAASATHSRLRWDPARPMVAYDRPSAINAVRMTDAERHAAIQRPRCRSINGQNGASLKTSIPMAIEPG